MAQQKKGKGGVGKKGKEKEKEKKNGVNEAAAAPTVWFSLKKSLHCRSERSDVIEPKSSSSSKSSSNNSHNKQHPQRQNEIPNHLSNILTRKSGRSGCSRSIANLKDVIHGSKRHIEKPPSNNSPRSIGSSEFLNPIVHEVILNNTTCELKITGFGGGFSDGGGGGNPSGGGGGDGGGSGSMFVGTLRPGTPGPKGHPSMHYFRNSSSAVTPPRKLSSDNSDGNVFGGVNSKRRNSVDSDFGNGSANISCHKCGEHFVKWELLEAHHLSKHAVTELVEGDSSRKIVEIICRASWLKSENQCGRIERVLKVHNMQKTIARFEEYRETVKIKASKLPKKHPRCLADGNELLRFHGTTVACSLGLNGSSSLCVSERCCVCRIIRHGFTARKKVNGGIGVFTTSTSGRAFESIDVGGEREVEGEMGLGNNNNSRKALIVCRVIAGRVHKPVENVQEMMVVDQMTGFDSLAGKVGVYSNIEELYLLNPKALLPCFVVICRS